MSSWPRNGLSDSVSTTLARVDVGNLSRHGATKEVATRVAREMTDRPIAPANNLLAVSARVLGTDAQGRITGKLKSVEEYGRSFGDDDQSLTLLSKFKTYEKEVDMANRKHRFRTEDIELVYKAAIAGGIVDGFPKPLDADAAKASGDDPENMVMQDYVARCVEAKQRL
jgi:hypothetical protein